MGRLESPVEIGLSFLTSLQTFFQSGIIQWKETPEIVGEWLFRTEVFRLFMAICLPMTILTLFCWLLVNFYARVETSKEVVKVAAGPSPEKMTRPPELAV